MINYILNFIIKIFVYHYILFYIYICIYNINIIIFFLFFIIYLFILIYYLSVLRSDFTFLLVCIYDWILLFFDYNIFFFANKLYQQIVTREIYNKSVSSGKFNDLYEER